MKMVTILFTYNRPIHTKKVLQGLEQSYIHPKELYIFQDGPRADTDMEKWSEVNQMIKAVSFCDTHVIVSKANKGLARSIMDGTKYVASKCDAFIVLEDDCVPTKNFLGYMYSSIEKYRDEKRVYCITGYANKCTMDMDEYDAYFVRRTSSWGWATWSYCWNEFKPNPSDMDELRMDSEKSKQLLLWGNDLSNMLDANLNRGDDTWAIYWVLHVMSRDGLCLMPYKSLINNIGFDGTGVHGDCTREFDVDVEAEDRREWHLPNDISPNEGSIKYYLSHYGGYTALNTDKSKPHISIYGLGKYFRLNEKAITEKYYIECFIDKNKKGFWGGKEIIRPDVIEPEKITKVFVSLLNINEGRAVAAFLENEMGIERENIKVLGCDGFL